MVPTGRSHLRAEGPRYAMMTNLVTHTTPSTLSFRVKDNVGPLHIEADVDLSTPWTVLFGPSGSGKSSLLRLIAGLWTPNEAAVHLGNEDIARLPPHKRRIAMVSQQPALFPHMTVHQNIAFGCNPSNRDQWLQELLEAFSLTTLARAKPATLSGGERQRVAIARALANQPRYLLLDEVFTGMHTPLRQYLIATLRTYGERLNMPVLAVTHDLAEALQADESLKLHGGRITAQGPPAAVLAVEREALLHQLNNTASSL